MSQVHRNIHQDKTIKNLKSSLKENQCMTLIDFSENFQCKYSTEVQGVHFGASRQQVTIHSGMLYIKDKSQGFATLSENLRHDSCAVTAHLKKILTEVISRGLLNNMDTIHFVSDGPTAQYKNKNMIYLATQYLTRCFPQFKNITYNYSESGHGKSPADGVAACVKHMGDDIVKYALGNFM